MNKIEVLIPTAAPRADELEMAKRPNSLEGKVLGLLWNAKPNGDLLLMRIGRILNDRFRFSEINMRRKPLASSGASLGVIEELSAGCDFVITAIGD